MANEIQSKEILIKYDDEVIARATGYSLEVNKEVIDVTTLDSGGWARVLGGLKSWNVSTDALVIRGSATGQVKYSDLMLEIFNNDSPVELIIETGTAGDFAYSGNVIITALSQSGANGETLTYSVTFNGDGALSQNVIA